MEFDDPLFGPGIGSAEYRERHLSHPDPVVRERRRKVIERYPDLGTDILVGDVLELVDAGLSWEDAFLSRVAANAGIRSVPKSLLRMCAGKSFAGGGIHNLASIAARLPEEWLPEVGTDEADAFLEIAGAVNPLIPHGFEDEVPSLFANCGGRWMAWRDRLLASISPEIADMDEDETYQDADEGDTFDDFPRHAISLFDGIEKAGGVTVGFANQVVIPTLVRDLGVAFPKAVELGYETSIALLLKGATLEDFLGLTRYYDADASSSFDSALYERLADTELPEWRPLVPRTDLDQGIVAVPITTPHALLDEMRLGMNIDGSFGLGIGTGGHLQKCMRGNGFVLSLRTSRGTRSGAIIASYDHDVLPDRARFEMVQDGAKIRSPWPGIVIRAILEGPNGERVDETTLRAFKRLAVGIAEGRVPVLAPPPADMIESGEDLVEMRQEGETALLANPVHLEREDIDALAEYPVAARGAVEAAFEAWKPYLPAYLRTSTFEQLASMIELAARDQEAAYSDATRRHCV